MNLNNKIIFKSGEKVGIIYENKLVHAFFINQEEFNFDNDEEVYDHHPTHVATVGYNGDVLTYSYDSLLKFEETISSEKVAQKDKQKKSNNKSKLPKTSDENKK